MPTPLVDPKCYDLARHFLETVTRSETITMELASHFQQIAEDFLKEVEQED